MVRNGAKHPGEQAQSECLSRLKLKELKEKRPGDKKELVTVQSRYEGSKLG